MAIINIRIDDTLKRRVDFILKKQDTSPTKIIRELYLYIAENERLPFASKSLVKTKQELIQEIVNKLRDLRLFSGEIINISDDNMIFAKENRLEIMEQVKDKKSDIVDSLFRYKYTISDELFELSQEIVQKCVLALTEYLEKNDINSAKAELQLSNTIMDKLLDTFLAEIGIIWETPPEISSSELINSPKMTKEAISRCFRKKPKKMQA
ncbi:type II toxin-antitoxin system RelB/DinJ family antitoxin [Xenorhabdus cabanillasii]|uniref:Antitoxin RelB (Modular protein) n=1 Tax=Xenorhabdus cabanillasii JM26 TaxID=1427517 RepID=W1J9T9_9GAMM|nr:type II toxin-antitoxin system RelB/DinJ family antitoxin [Xenorhabdus cabanillasii]PHM75514.1 transcriptional regulator [Xenorhabdus cabanillasii JM26]CDL86651.1 Antitoxin RelB (modular protein) [Xenorhabdus cabanillasii JM26]